MKRRKGLGDVVLFWIRRVGGNDNGGANSFLFTGYVCHYVQGAVYVGGLDSVMCYHSKAHWGECEAFQGFFAQAIGELITGEAVCGEAEVDHVGDDGVEVDGEALDLGNAFCEAAGVCVVVGEAIYHLLQGDDACRGDDAALSHAAADGFANASCGGDELRRAADDGTDRCGEAFAEAECNRMDPAREFVHVEA